MEVAGAKKIFQSSLPWYNVRFITFLGDGDSQTFNSVEQLKLYGRNVTVSKLKCVGHVQKLSMRRDYLVMGNP
jgi:hypothetical protein